MPLPSSDLPPWLRHSGAAPRGSNNRAAVTAAFAVLLFAAGAGSGFLYARRGEPVAPPPPPPAPVCPPAVVCAPPPTGTGTSAHLKLAAASKHTKTPPKKLTPLPDKPQMDEGELTKALHEFAQNKSSELRDCIPEPDRGPTLKLGAAFELTADGAVDMVQILGADTAPKDVKSCYVKRLKRWRFPEELLRGEEKVIVNFVL